MHVNTGLAFVRFQIIPFVGTRLNSIKPVLVAGFLMPILTYTYIKRCFFSVFSGFFKLFSCANC